MSYKYLSISVILITLFSGCNSGSNSSPSSTSGSSTEAASTGIMFGSVDSPANLTSTVDSKALLPAGSGVVYNIPVINTSTTNTLSVSSQNVSNYGAQVWSVESTVPSTCQNIASGSSCTLQVGFNAANVESASQMSSLLTINYSNGNSSSIPLAGAIIAPGNGTSGTGITVSSPGIIAVNESGFGSGVITLFNSESFEQSVLTSGIAATSQQGVSWNFNVQCGDSNSSVIAPLSSCSISYTYHVSSTTAETPSPVTISIPVTSSATNIVTTIMTEPSQQIPLPSTTTPLPYLVYPSAAPVYLPAVDSGLSGWIVVKNVGNTVLSGITATPSVNTLQVDTSRCSNLAAYATCAISVVQTAVTPAATVTLHPASGSSGPIIVSVGGQALLSTPNAIDFGTTVFTGSKITKLITIRNQSATTALNSLTITDSELNVAYSIESINSCNAELAALTSCQVAVTYTPTESGIQTGIVNINAILDTITEAQVSTVLGASSVSSSWTNLLSNPPSKYPVFPIPSMYISDLGRLLFGITPPIGSTESGVSNIWHLDNGNNYFNLTGFALGYDNQSAPTALATLPGVDVMDIGHSDGSVQRCPISTSFIFCGSIVATSTANLGVTSLLHINDLGAIFISYADNINGTVGQVLFESNTQNSPIAVDGITAGVGIMATDSTLIYAPLTNGQLATIDGSGVVVSSNIAPATLMPNEYPTVAYISNTKSTLFIGTNQGNVYMSTALPASTEVRSWTKLTTTSLSSQSIVSALAQDNEGKLFVGLHNLANPTIGGGVYLLDSSSSTFISAPGYTDSSAVFVLLTNLSGTSINVATYNGNIWTNE